VGERSGVQRVRIGLTGLAFVFILVLLGAVFARPTNEPPITGNMIERQLAHVNEAAPADENGAEPKEPLAELGVAPGNGGGNGASPARTAR
jgi:hypothetical protein